jgi:hypothetical protein
MNIWEEHLRIAGPPLVEPDGAIALFWMPFSTAVRPVATFTPQRSQNTACSAIFD